MKASAQWNKREADERFWTVEDMMVAAKRDFETARESDVPFAALRAEAVEGGLHLVGPERVPASMTNWAFRQVCKRIGAGQAADWIQKLPVTLAAQNLNHGLKTYGEELGRTANLLLRSEGGTDVTIRSVTTDFYNRIWDWEVCERGVQQLVNDGWRTPPAGKPWSSIDNLPTRIATEADCSDFTGIKPGDTIVPSGVYRGDRDMFVFLVDDRRPIEVNGRKFARGAFFWNGEVGERSLGYQTFLYDFTCQNHIVWNATNVRELRVAHTGQQLQKFFVKATIELREYAESSGTDIEAKIEKAQRVEIAGTRDDVLDTLFGKRVLPRKRLQEAYELCEQFGDGDPMTVWGMVSGITRLSQTINPFADKRVELDRAASKVMKLSF